MAVKSTFDFDQMLSSAREAYAEERQSEYGAVVLHAEGVSAHGRIDASEKPEFSVLLKMMDDMALILSEARLAGEKTLKE